MLKSLMYALSFLTILPLPYPEPLKCSEEEIGGSTSSFPIVGLIRGVILYWIYLLLHNLFSVEITAALILIAHVLINGAFHLDGLSDTFDAIASRKETDDCLRIMKESTSGPAGVTALILVLILKFALFSLAIESGRPDSLVVFPMAGAWAMVVAMFYGKAAKTDGLGYIFVKHTGRGQFLKATLSTVLAVLLFASVFRGWASLLFCLLVTLGMVSYFSRRFGGLTGDTLGTVAEINEIIFLLFYLL